MKISHAQLESARINPAAFLKALKGPSDGFKPWASRFSTVRLSVYEFHRTGNDVTKAMRYLREAEERGFRRHGGRELVAMERQLRNYVDDFTALGNAVAQARCRIKFPIAENLVMTGEIPRLDVVPSGGYLVCLFQKKRSKWQQELRCPLLQHIFASEWNAPISEVTLAMHAFEPRGYEVRQFTRAEIDDALTEISTLAKELA